MVAVEATSAQTIAFTHGPNPARGGGVLRFQLPDAARVQLDVYDAAGRRVARLADGIMTAGAHSVQWLRTDDGGRRVGPGVYLARLKSGEVEKSLHIVLLD